MSNGPLRDAAQQLGRVAFAQAEPAPGDGELVTRFAASREEAAFAELVRRHGPTVFGVCRRIVGDSHEAEDAFQAVFVVLARKAGAIQPPGAVGGWLYGVAVRIARKAQAMAAKRRRRQADLARSEREFATPRTPETAELRAAIDRELLALSAEHRTVLVLADLNGKSRSEIARELGWPEGTVASRLAKARELLASRLRKRGVTLGVASLAAVLSSEASASVPVHVSSLAVTVALGAPAAIPSAVLTLSNGAIQTMKRTTLKLLACMIGVLGIGGVGALLATGNPSDKPTPDATPKPVAAPAPAPAPDKAVWKEREAIKLDGWLAGSLAYTLDGEKLLVGGTGGNVHAYSTGNLQGKPWAIKTNNKFSVGPYKSANGDYAAVAVRPDGRVIGVTVDDGIQIFDTRLFHGFKTQPGEDVPATTIYLIEEKGSKPTAIAWFPYKAGETGDKPLTRTKLVFGNSKQYVVKEWLTGAKPGTITTAVSSNPADPHAVPLAVDPNGRCAIMTGPIDQKTGKNVLWAYVCGDYDEGSPGNRIMEGHKAAVVSAAWSKDGKVAATGDADGVVIVWDPATMKEKTRVNLGGRVASLSLTADGSRMAAAVTGPQEWMERQVEQWVVAEWTPTAPNAKPVVVGRRIEDGPFQGVASVAYSPDGKQLAAAFCNFDKLKRLNEIVGYVRVWDQAPAK